MSADKDNQPGGRATGAIPGDSPVGDASPLPEEVLGPAEERLKAGEAKREETKRNLKEGQYGRLDTQARLRARVERVTQDPVTRRELESRGDDLVESLGTGADSVLDDELLERIINGENFLGVSFFDLGKRAARCVGRVEIRTPEGRSGSGSGSMVTSRLFLTNNHVLRDIGWARGSRVVFDHEDDADGNPRPTVTFAFDPDALFLTDKTLDFTLVAVREEAAQPANARLFGYGFNPLDPSPGKIAVGEVINIIQHPSGMHKQVVLQDNRVLDIPDDTPEWLHYQADTLPGSSGAPLFNNRWEVVGLHHSGWPRRDPVTKKILTKKGGEWTKDMGELAIDWLGNEGARVSHIVKKASEARPTLKPEAQALLDELLNPPKQGAIVVAGGAPDSPTPREEGAGGVVKTLQSPLRPPAEKPLPQASGLSTAGETTAKPRPADKIIAPVAATSPDGSVTITVPLQITLSLGILEVAATNAPAAPTVEGPAAPAGQTAAPKVNDHDGRRERARAGALRELEEAAERPYYDSETDAAERETYYEGIDLSGAAGPDALYDALSELLGRTHENKLPYRPARHLYHWVDIHPDRKLRSLYTGEVYEPAGVIEEAFEIEAEFDARREMLLANEATFEDALSLLEAGPAFNCEHVVPQSWFRGPNSATPKGDLHHLFTCQYACNGFRGNVPFWDFEDFNESLMQGCGRKEADKFEPVRGKGPAARATLYFLLRYPGLVDDVSSELQARRIDTLLAWHASEAAGEYERHRNAAIYRVQGNRNPLIDFAEVAGRINFSRGLNRGAKRQSPPNGRQ